MKEIKAYIQRECVNRTVDELQRAGAPGITIVEIHPVGYGYEPNYFETSFEDAFKRYSYLRIVKLEVVCADHETDRLVEVIQKACATGEKGDGMIFISDVSKAVRIRDGTYGEAALGNERPVCNQQRSESEATSQFVRSRSCAVNGALRDQR